MDKLRNSEDARKFLRGIGLCLNEAVVRQVVDVISGKTNKSRYSLYATRQNKPAPICGKGTTYKIQKLYREGKLQPYVDYLSDQPTTGEAEPDVPEDSQTEGVPHTKEPDSDKYAQYRREHMIRLARLAEELRECIVPWYSSGFKKGSRFGGKIQPETHVFDSEMEFSARHNLLWKCLLDHLDAEYKEPRFSEELHRWQIYGAKLDWENRLTVPSKAEELRFKLWLVIERELFKGTCDICRDWK